MIEILEKAFAEVAKLPEDQQQSFAQWIMDELQDEQRWNRAFSQSMDKLEQLGKQALADYQGGRTDELDPDTLE